LHANKAVTAVLPPAMFFKQVSLIIKNHFKDYVQFVQLYGMTFVKDKIVFLTAIDEKDCMRHGPIPNPLMIQISHRICTT